MKPVVSSIDKHTFCKLSNMLSCGSIKPHDIQQFVNSNRFGYFISKSIKPNTADKLSTMINKIGYTVDCVSWADIIITDKSVDDSMCMIAKVIRNDGEKILLHSDNRSRSSIVKLIKSKYDDSNVLMRDHRAIRHMIDMDGDIAYVSWFAVNLFEISIDKLLIAKSDASFITAAHFIRAVGDQLMDDYDRLSMDNLSLANMVSSNDPLAFEILKYQSNQISYKSNGDGLIMGLIMVKLNINNSSSLKRVIKFINNLNPRFRGDGIPCGPTVSFADFLVELKRSLIRYGLMNDSIDQFMQSKIIEWFKSK